MLGGTINPFINRLRGILAMGVVCWHVLGMPGQIPFSTDIWQGVFGPLVLFSGFNYVVGFIVVSGYCIARSTLKRDFTFARYMALRITRIYPALIACACIAGIVELVLFESPHRLAVWNSGITVHNFGLSLIGLSGFYGQFGSYAATYTVSYELLFYVIWGAVFAATPTTIAVPTSAIVGAGLYFVLPMNYHFALVLFGAWLIGAALAVYEKEIIRVARHVPLWLMWLVVIWAYVTWNGLTGPLGGLMWSAPACLSYLPLGLLFAIVMACHLARNGPALQLDDWLGDISYPLFLVHIPIVMATGSAIKASGVTLSYFAIMAVYFASSILVAQGVLVLVERPVMRMRYGISIRPANLSAHPAE